jgi:hypothetical protein
MSAIVVLCHLHLTVFGFAAGVDSKVQKFVHLQMFKKVKLFTLADCHACAKPML